MKVRVTLELDGESAKALKELQGCMNDNFRRLYGDRLARRLRYTAGDTLRFILDSERVKEEIRRETLFHANLWKFAEQEASNG